MINKAFIFLLITAIFIQPALSETLIYDNISAAGYKYLVIQDDLNIKYINEYTYDVELNGYYMGSYKKGEKIFYPDNSTLNIHFKAPITTEISSNIMGTVIKPTLMLFLGFAFTWGLGIIIVMIVIHRIYRDYIKRR